MKANTVNLDGRRLRELRWSVKPSVNLYELYRKTKIQVSVLSGIENGTIVPSEERYKMLEETILKLMEERLRSGEAKPRLVIPEMKRAYASGREERDG